MLLERERQLQDLQRLASRVSSGAGGMALVLGEAGIGKSSLLQAFAAPLKDEFFVLQGACEDLSTPRVLGPLRDFAPALGQDVVSAIDNAASPDVLMPMLLGHLAAQPRPVLVMCEDLHWADQATLDLLKYLARRIGGQHTMLLASARNDELPPDHAFWRWAGDLPPPAPSASTCRPCRRKRSPLSRTMPAAIPPSYTASLAAIPSSFPNC